QGSSVAAARPEGRDAAKWERLNHESDLRKALREKCLAALIGGGYATTGNEIYSQFNGLRHRFAVIRPHLQRGKRCAPSCLCKELRQDCGGPQGRDPTAQLQAAPCLS